MLINFILHLSHEMNVIHCYILRNLDSSDAVLNSENVMYLDFV